VGVNTATHKLPKGDVSLGGLAPSKQEERVRREH
jgi:hypothetical protein